MANLIVRKDGNGGFVASPDRSSGSVSFGTLLKVSFFLCMAVLVVGGIIALALH